MIRPNSNKYEKRPRVIEMRDPSSMAADIL